MFERKIAKEQLYHVKENMDLFGAISLVSITILTIFYAFFKYSFQYWKSRGIPYDEPSIPFGNIRDYGSSIHISRFLKKFYDKHKSNSAKNAKMCGIYFFARPVAILLDLELVKAVLVKDFVQFNERGLYICNASIKS